ncbi:MAG TPA: hypothetical protein VJ978_08265 [Nitriliruptoraceae bacterium]|nr:hypothetical protein [Nitriliruptoraceae bacterium]
MEPPDEQPDPLAAGPDEPRADERPTPRRSPDGVATALISTDHPHMEVVDVAASGTPVPIDLRDYVVFSPDHATRVRTVAGDHLALDLWCVEPQQSTGVLQYASHDVVYTVIGGRSWFVTEAGDVGLDPMGSLLVPAGTVHGIDNRGADPLIVSMAMAPPDEVDVDAPTGPGLAIRDDSQYGTFGRKARAAFERLIGR